MNNLYFIAFRKSCRIPFGATDYPSVDFYGKPFRFEIEQRDQTGNRYAIGDFATLSVYKDVQVNAPDDFRW